jgi:hypothetical protein
MSGAILLISHTPLWRGQGQLYCLTFICPKIIKSVWKQVDNLFCKHENCEKIWRSDGILHNLWDLKAHYYVYISPPNPILSNPFHVIPSYFFKFHYNTFTVVSVLPASLSNPCINLFLPHTCHIPHPPPRYKHPNNIRYSVQIIKFLVMQFSQVPCSFLSIGPKYLPQHPLFELPQCMFFP